MEPILFFQQFSRLKWKRELILSPLSILSFILRHKLGLFPPWWSTLFFIPPLLLGLFFKLSFKLSSQLWFILLSILSQELIPFFRPPFQQFFIQLSGLQLEFKISSHSKLSISPRFRMELTYSIIIRTPFIKFGQEWRSKRVILIFVLRILTL